MISLFQCRVMFGGAVIGGGEGRDEAAGESCPAMRAVQPGTVAATRIGVNAEASKPMRW
jgi:hypothetical protein